MKKTNLFKTLALFLLMPTLVIASCDKTSDSNSSDEVHEHDYGTLVEKVDATCTEVGHIAYYHCTGCDKYFNENKEEITLNDTIIQAKGHTVVKDAAVAATCETAGKTEGSHCSVCNAVISAQQTINATGHAYGNWTITKSPTLEQTGTAQRVCGNDSTHKETATLNALSDTSFWTKTTIEATCTVDGEDSYFNSTYGTVKVKIDKIGHDYGAWTITVEPTETTTGKATRTCTHDAGHIEETTLKVLTDTSMWTKSTTASTCTVAGKDVYTSDYGTVEVALPLAEHQYVWVVDKAATKLEEGSRHQECSVCGIHKEGTDNTVIPIVTCDHEHVTHIDAVAETCETVGSREYYYCEDCHKYYEDAECQNLIELTESLDINGWKEIPAKNHNYGNWNIEQPTADTEGSATRTCANDAEHVETVTLPVLNADNYTIDTQEATCTTSGLVTYTYKENTSISFSNTIDIIADNHNYGEWIITDPTEEAAGEAKKVCSYNESHEIVVTLPNLKDTDFWGCAYTAPTCEVDGSRVYTSKEEHYGKTFTYTVVLDKLGHKYDGETTYTNEDGKWYKHTACSNKNCESVKDEEITVISVSDFITNADTENASYVKGYVVSAQSKSTAQNMQFHISDGVKSFYVNTNLAVKLGDEVLIYGTYKLNNGQVGIDTPVLCKVISSNNDYKAVSGTPLEKTASEIATEISAIVDTEGKTYADLSPLFDGNYYKITGYYIAVDMGTYSKYYVSTAATDGTNVIALSANGDYDLTVYAGQQIEFYGFLRYADSSTFGIVNFQVQDIDVYGAPRYNITVSDSIVNGTVTTQTESTVLTNLKYGTKVSFVAQGTETDTDKYEIDTLTINSVADADAAGTKYSFVVTVLGNTEINATFKIVDPYATKTSTALISSIISANSWTDSSVKHTTINIDDVLVASCSETGSNDGKCYTTDWRLYKNGFLKLSVAKDANEDYLPYTIKSLTVTYSGDSAITGLTSGTKVDLSSNICQSVQYSVTATAKVTKIVVEYALLTSEQLETASIVAAISTQLDAITNPFAANYTQVPNAAITLPTSSTEGYTTAWTIETGNTCASISDNALTVALSTNGVVNVTVRVTITQTAKSISSHKDFTFTVADKYVEALKNISVNFSSEYSEATSVTLDTDCGYSDLTIVWTSSNTTYATITGSQVAITVPTTGSEDITLTATIDGTDKTKEFTFIVSAPSGFNKVTYTISSTTNVTASGTAPTGSVATYSQTHSTKGKATKSKGSIKLVLTGYDGMIIKGITINCSSNKSGGGGTLTITAGDESLVSINAKPFSDASWNGNYSTTAVDVDFTLSNDSYEIQSEEIITIDFLANADSMIFYSFTIEWVEAED